MKSTTTENIGCRTQRGGAARLGEAVAELMRDLKPRYTRMQGVDQNWARLVPAGMAAHSRPVSLSGGRLKVVADSPAYLYELRLCSDEIIESLRRHCPRAGVNELRIIPG